MKNIKYYPKVFDSLEGYIKWVEGLNSENIEIVSVIPIDNKIVVTLKKEEEIYYY